MIYVITDIGALDPVSFGWASRCLVCARQWRSGRKLKFFKHHGVAVVRVGLRA